MAWPTIVTVELMGSDLNWGIFLVVESTGLTNGIKVACEGEESKMKLKSYFFHCFIFLEGLGDGGHQ